MAEGKSALKVNQLRPGTSGHTLTVKVVNSKKVLNQRRGGPSQMKMSEVLVGDETGMIVFTAKNNHVDLMKDGATLIIKDAKIEMYKGSMRLAVDRRGIIETASEPASFTVMEDNNLSLIEFDLVNVVEE